MARCEVSCGEGRGEVSLWADSSGEALVAMLYNSAVHIGAVAVGEYDSANDRASVSVITRLGHKDDIVAYRAAHTISKVTHKPVCVSDINLFNLFPPFRLFCWLRLFHGLGSITNHPS
ncbi:hypothetical protein ACFLV0_07510 [Chloroflexota bacterium]